MTEPLDESGNYFIHTHFPVPAAWISGRSTLSMPGITFLDVAVMYDIIGVGGAEINGCDNGLDVQQQLAVGPLATAALSVQSTIAAASKQHASQTLCLGGAPFRPWSSTGTQPMTYLKLVLVCCLGVI